MIYREEAMADTALTEWGGAVLVSGFAVKGQLLGAVTLATRSVTVKLHYQATGLTRWPKVTPPSVPASSTSFLMMLSLVVEPLLLSLASFLAKPQLHKRR